VMGWVNGGWQEYYSNTDRGNCEVFGDCGGGLGTWWVAEILQLY
jgi:hypothetical protein